MILRMVTALALESHRLDFQNLHLLKGDLELTVSIQGFGREILTSGLSKLSGEAFGSREPLSVCAHSIFAMTSATFPKVLQVQKEGLSVAPQSQMDL